MSTDRSDILYAQWRESTEKFDYFILGILSALCAYIGQGYKAAPLGSNPATLELLALLLLIAAVVSGFMRAEKFLLLMMINQRQLYAYEARGNLVTKMGDGRPLLNEATGDIYSHAHAIQRSEHLSDTINKLEEQMKPAAKAAQAYYHSRNVLALFGFLTLVAARVWSAYA